MSSVKEVTFFVSPVACSMARLSIFPVDQMVRMNLDLMDLQEKIVFPYLNEIMKMGIKRNNNKMKTN